MKLKTKFMILVCGIVIFPFLVSALIFFIQFVRTGKELPVSNLKSFENWISTGESRAKLEEMLDLFINNRVRGIEILIMDRDNRVLKSTFPGLEAVKNLGQDQLLGYIRKNAENYHFLVNVFPVIDINNTVILKVKKINSLEDKIHKRILVTLEVALLIFLAAAFFSILIIRSFTQAIIRLKTATIKIAGGDLDFTIKAKGRDEIADLTRAFDKMRLALKDEYGRRARFLMGVSHDLKTPLALILGYVEAISDGHAGDEAQLRHFLAIIKDKSRLLEQRISDLIGYVKLATGEWRMIHKDIPLAAFLNRVAGHYEKDAAILKRKFSYQLDLPETLVIPMDERLMERALENIIANAIRYTNEQDLICLKAEVRGADVVLTISDSGPGIKTEELDKIFDPFYRGSHSRQEPGLGLGLSTVRSIIQAHGWDLSVSSVPGQETVFRITLKVNRDRHGV